jgi:Na+-transporting methylmalonyl-CoA/oxaloacetate decarboxylase gamma subunit
MNNLLLALQITALGMGLVFAAIILLWWMMNLLTWLMADRGASPKDNADSASTADRDRQAQAAAVAVAIALAEQQASHAHPLDTPPTASISAWQMGMRTRQLHQKGLPTRR